jgi:hypothetical protein
MEEALDLDLDYFTQKELEDLAALNPELQHLHIMVQSQPQVSKVVKSKEAARQCVWGIDKYGH